jgi:hypothetical protein
MMPYAAPKRIEMYMDPGSENIWTLGLAASYGTRNNVQKVGCNTTCE